ncbi:MAG: PD40 domain-containing protein [Balneolaceae bacterium]|nr:PD40 domain-containing protein [Balneolaceae bacterium]MBO6547788.1 PD40 domain-containing protein [Balneolaceae bacterium]MBO6648299.1 PD40 domain-containing protein [Balneolaceae bacterium]
MKRLVLGIVLVCFSQSAIAQINAKLMSYFDVSETQITFVYGGDLWLVPKEGGTAIQITNSPGEENFPRFSPDGTHIAYSASYNGNTDVYVIPVTGGIPTRVTYQSHGDRMVEWHPDGEHLLFASRRHLGQRSSRQFYKVSKDGGMPEKLPIPYGELASYSPDGNKLAYITKITENYPFKRYYGGLASDILIYDFRTQRVVNVTENEVNDGKPAWAGDHVYYLSDKGENFRLNVWSYDINTETHSQITSFEDFDVSYLSAGPDDLVFEVGGQLYIMDLASQQYKPVNVHVISDLSTEMPRSEDVSGQISDASASPEGKRIIFEARGELFNAPVKDGYTINLTKSSGAFDRDPAWSPDGETIAYWSDKSGEYEIYLQDHEGEEAPRKLTNRGEGYGYRLYWSPDSKHIAFIDETNTIYTVEVENGDVTEVGNTYWNVGHGGRGGYPITWSSDSNWLTFHKGLDNSNFVIMLYDVQESELHQVTSGFYSESNAVFTNDGKYLVYTSNRDHNVVYSDLDNTWTYPNSTRLVAVSLTEDVPSPLAPKNDALEKKEESTKEEGDDDETEEEPGLAIEFDGLQTRTTVLPPEAGNIGQLMAFDGMVVYRRWPNTGSSGGAPLLVGYDFEKREEVTIMEGVSSARPTADGKSILVSSRGRYGIIQPKPGQSISDAIPTDGLEMDLIPKEEWRQIFADTWRRYRDFFYDPNMHGVDWDEMKERYGALIEDARTRWDVTNIQSNMQAELSAGHTYTFGGDNETVDFQGTGYLGIDWEKDDNMFRIQRIVTPAEWDTEVRSPFDRPGVDVSVGDYIHSVNGITLDPDKDPYAAFEGLDGETVSLIVSSNGRRGDARQVIIETLTQGEEAQLRYLEWIENNRKMVEELSDGQLGYIYMSNTAGRGQLELVKMYYGQLDKKGFIIDERFNGGGQLADRFLELLMRPVVYNLHWRHGRDHTQPIQTNTGPMGMLINGWAGSGGDGLPWAFQELEAGPIVGERTLGILVGPATGHGLIDGGGITVPGARLYDNDGHWFWEGEGVRPDFPVWDDPNLLMQGRDPQMEKVVEEVMKMVDENSNKMTPAPKPDDRTASGLRKGN